MGVMAIWRYPVKAMLGELLDAVEVGPGGPEGDRRWVVVDADTGERIANKRGPTDPRLRACRAELLDPAACKLPLRITLPDGQALEGVAIEEALSELLGRRVRLEIAGGPALDRIGATGSHHDAAPVHLITTSTLAHLRAVAPESDWDVRRFRVNLVLDDGEHDAGFGEDGLIGSTLRGRSGVALSVGLPTPRCVVPTRAQAGLPADPRILRTLVERHRFDLGPFGNQGCVGAYADVTHDGRVHTGERLEVRRGAISGNDAIRARIDRLVKELGVA